VALEAQPVHLGAEVVVAEALVVRAEAVLLVMVVMVGCTEEPVENEGLIFQTQVRNTEPLVQEVAERFVSSGVMAVAIRRTPQTSN